jgi:hypothetical protein
MGIKRKDEKIEPYYEQIDLPNTSIIKIGNRRGCVVPVEVVNAFKLSDKVLYPFIITRHEDIALEPTKLIPAGNSYAIIIPVDALQVVNCCWRKVDTYTIHLVIFYRKRFYKGEESK